MGAMKPSGGFSPSRASFLMRVPEMKSKSSCLCETERGDISTAGLSHTPEFLIPEELERPSHTPQISQTSHITHITHITRHRHHTHTHHTHTSHTSQLQEAAFPLPLSPQPGCFSSLVSIFVSHVPGNNSWRKTRVAFPGSPPVPLLGRSMAFPCALESREPEAPTNAAF